MKRNYTFELKRIFPDYNIKAPKDLEKRIGNYFKLIGEIKVGSELEMHFEDGYVFKTAPMEIHGFINYKDDEEKLVFATLCTKNIGYELEVIEKDINIKLIEQLKFA